MRESLFIPVGDAHDLHVEHFCEDPDGPPVLMIHGSVENGRVFYSAQTDRGLAPYLAKHGFDVFVADLRGRGESVPPIGPDSDYGQTEAIIEDIPALGKAVGRWRPGRRQHWVAHSWGGVLVASCLVRFAALRARVASLTFFGTKRSIRVTNLDKLYYIDILWNRVAYLMVRLYGYLPAKRLGVGSDNETARSHDQCVQWAKPSPWKDGSDGFDYGRAAAHNQLPPLLAMTGVNDRFLGHPKDVRAFLAELSTERLELHVLSRERGNLRDYGHIDILTHPDAERDHFPTVVDWLRAY